MVSYSYWEQRALVSQLAPRLPSSVEAGQVEGGGYPPSDFDRGADWDQLVGGGRQASTGRNPACSTNDWLQESQVIEGRELGSDLPRSLARNFHNTGKTAPKMIVSAGRARRRPGPLQPSQVELGSARGPQKLTCRSNTKSQKTSAPRPRRSEIPLRCNRYSTAIRATVASQRIAGTGSNRVELASRSHNNTA